MTHMLDDATMGRMVRRARAFKAPHRRMAFALYKEGLDPAQIARRLEERTGVARRPETIRKVLEKMERRAAGEEKLRAVYARLRALFNEGAQVHQAAKIIRREFNHHLSDNGVASAWRSMGLRRPRPDISPDRYRGKLPIPVHAHPLVRQLFEHLNREMTTMQEVAERAGVNRLTIGGWGRSKVPNIVTFEAVLNTIDLELCIRPRKVPA